MDNRAIFNVAYPCVTFKFLKRLLHALNDYALRCADEYGHLDVVKYLIEMGSDVHARYDEALRCASERGHLDVARYLVGIGADVHAH